MARPPKYKTAEVLKKVADLYFKNCDEHSQLPEKAGLCLTLGISRDTYSEYRNDRFPDTIKGFDLYIESCWVRRLNSNSPTGAIFYLKNAYREHYNDSHDVTSGGERIVSTNLTILSNDQLERLAGKGVGRVSEERTGETKA